MWNLFVRFTNGIVRLSRRNTRPIQAVAIAGAILLVLPAHAHPHVWIDMRTAVLFDALGRVTGVRVHWLFDDFYSLFATDGLKKDADGYPSSSELRELARTNLENLKPYSYFTYIKSDGKTLPYGKVEAYESAMSQGRLGMVFTVPLAEPVDPRLSHITYAVYDPTYYIEILHVQHSPVLLEGSVPSSCKPRLQAPNPTPEAVALAAALDRTDTAGDGLGELFAEFVSIGCPKG